MELTHRQQQRERSLVGHSVPVLSLQVAQISFNTAPCLLQLSPPPPLPPSGSLLLSILPSMPSRLECSCLPCPVFYLRSLPDVGLGISISYERSFDVFDWKDVSLPILFAYHVHCVNKNMHMYKQTLVQFRLSAPGPFLILLSGDAWHYGRVMKVT